MNSTIRESLEQLLGPTAEPVAITFCDTPPSGVPRVASPAPAGCSYWQLAGRNGVFYTAAEDHGNCPIGAYTHGAELDATTQAQLEEMIGTMVSLGYLRTEEVPGIPHRDAPLRFAVYAPLSKAEGTPDVVIMRGNASQMMLLTEAVNSRGLMSPFPIMGRPACAVIPAALSTGKAVTSLGCIGNRVYTGLPAGEFYVALPGRAMGDVVQALETVVAANRELEKFHRARAR
jgi:uncharacterized protein (DUF169 family)